MKDNLKFYICDDENKYVNIIKSKLYEHLGGERRYETVVFDSGEELLENFRRQPVDAVFLDIDMPKMNGFETASLLQEIEKDILIVFVTSHEDKVYQSYEYHPFWFVRKSHMHDFEIVLKNLIAKIDIEEEKRYFIYEFKAENRAIELDINTLMYITAYKNNLIIKDKNAGEIKIRCKIAEAEKQLYPLNIIRIQKGVMVNCRYIASVTSREVVLTNGETFNLSRSKVDFVKEEYQNFVRRTLV